MSEPISNYNITYNTNYKLEVPDAPHLNYFLQQVTLPSISNTRDGFLLPAQSDIHLF